MRREWGEAGKKTMPAPLAAHGFGACNSIAHF